MPRTVDAVIIGAGVAGSTLAYALAKAGWTVVLADKSAFPRHKACGEFLSPESFQILRSLGLSETFNKMSPVPIDLARIHAERGGSLEIPMSEPAFGISRYVLDAGLHQAAMDAGAVIRTSSQAAAVKELNGMFQVELGPDKELIFARTVFGAWGRTPLRGVQLASAGKRNARPRIGIKIHYDAQSDIAVENARVVDLYFFRGGYAGISNVEGGRLNVAALLTGPMEPAGRIEAMLERILAQAARQVPALRERLAGAKPVPGTEAGAYPVVPGPNPLAWRNIPLIGDAAAVIPPLCGDGMAMALRSAALSAPLADAYLRGRISKAQWRERYAAQLEREFAIVLRRADRLARLLELPWAAPWLLRLGKLVPAAAVQMFRATRLKI